MATRRSTRQRWNGAHCGTRARGERLWDAMTPPTPPRTPPPPAPSPAAEADKRASFEREALVHLDSLYRVALRLTGNPAEADDLVQETMLKAYRAWHQFERGTNAKGWLLTILRHAFINEYRRRTRHPETVDIDAIEPFSVFKELQDEDPQGTFFDRIVDDEVLRAIDLLPEQFRETVVLSDVEGMSYEEIARILEVPVGTVKSRLFRARRLLQQKLYDYAVGMGYIKGSAKRIVGNVKNTSMSTSTASSRPRWSRRSVSTSPTARRAARNSTSKNCSSVSSGPAAGPRVHPPT